MRTVILAMLLTAAPVQADTVNAAGHDTPTATWKTVWLQDWECECHVKIKNAFGETEDAFHENLPIVAGTQSTAYTFCGDTPNDALRALLSPQCTAVCDAAVAPWLWTTWHFPEPDPYVVVSGAQVILPRYDGGSLERENTLDETGFKIFHGSVLLYPFGSTTVRPVPGIAESLGFSAPELRGTVYVFGPNHDVRIRPYEVVRVAARTWFGGLATLIDSGEGCSPEGTLIGAALPSDSYLLGFFLATDPDILEYEDACLGIGEKRGVPTKLVMNHPGPTTTVLDWYGTQYQGWSVRMWCVDATPPQVQPMQPQMQPAPMP